MKTEYKAILAFLLYLAVLIPYTGYSVSEEKAWSDACRRDGPTVAVTPTGHRYHWPYHYSGRNRAMSLFDAWQKGYTPCGTCTPPYPPVTNWEATRPPIYLRWWGRIAIVFSGIYWLSFTRLIHVKAARKALPAERGSLTPPESGGTRGVKAPTRGEQ